MNKNIATITGAAILSVSVALSACTAIPTAVDTAQEGTRDAVAGPDEDAAETTDGKATADDSGLGSIVYNKKTRTKQCKKQRRTGSHLFRVGCSDPDSGSQPVRYGTYNDLGRLTMSGNVRPEN